MELELDNLFRSAMTLAVKYFFIVASDHMAPNHLFRLADDFKSFAHFVKRRHHYAIIELNDQHVLFVTPLCICNQLGALDLVIVEPCAKSLPIFGFRAVNLSNLIHFSLWHVRNPA